MGSAPGLYYGEWVYGWVFYDKLGVPAGYARIRYGACRGLSAADMALLERLWREDAKDCKGSVAVGGRIDGDVFKNFPLGFCTESWHAFFTLCGSIGDAGGILDVGQYGFDGSRRLDDG